MKLSNSQLKKIVFSHLPKLSPSVKIGPQAGVDGAVISFKAEDYVIVSDPVLGVPIKHFGFLAYHFSCNDISVMGAHPDYVFFDLMLPPKTSKSIISSIMKSFSKEAKKYNTSICGGHTGFYKGVNEPVASVTMIGHLIGSVKGSQHAKPGQDIIISKSPAFETAAALCFSFKDDIIKTYGKNIWNLVSHMVYDEACIEDVQKLRRFNPTSLHDCTEGGIAASLIEVAQNSNVKFNIGKIHFNKEVLRLLQEFSLNPLHSSSSGVVIATVNPNHTKALLKELPSAQHIGTVEKGEHVYLEGKKLTSKKDNYESITHF